MEDVLKGTREGLETPSSIPTETLFSSAPAARFATAVMPDRSLLAGYCSLPTERNRSKYGNWSKYGSDA